MYCHDLKVMSSNPGRVELGVLGTSVISIFHITYYFDKVNLSYCLKVTRKLILLTHLEIVNHLCSSLLIWKQRNLTIYGKILIIKAFALSQLLYVTAVCHIPKKIMTEVEHIIYEFLWNGKPHKVKTKVIIQDYANGGCKMIDLEEMIKAQKNKDD